MKRTIKEIVAVDKASRLDVEKAVKRREDLIEQVNKKRDEYDKRYKSEARDIVEAARKKADEDLKNQIEAIHTRTEEKKKELEESYEKNHTAWEKSIVENTLA